jgi:hypothetical protein
VALEVGRTIRLNQYKPSPKGDRTRMKLPKRLLAVAGLASAAAAAAPLMFSVNAANAAPAANTTVKVTTHLSNRPDTDNKGQLWAYDNMSRQFTITSDGAGRYTVDISDNGSFTSVLAPEVLNTPLSVHGSVTGVQEYIVNSSAAPDTSALPSQVGPTTYTSDMILKGLFHNDGTASFDGDGTYTYTYQAGGQTYTQYDHDPFYKGGLIG